VVGTLGGLFAATKIAALGIGAITFAFHALKLAMLTNPIGIALTALTVAGVLLWKNWEGVKGGMVAIWNSISSTAISAFNSVKASVGEVIDWLAQKTAWIFSTIDKVKAAASSIGGVFSGAKEMIGLGPSTPPPAGATASAAGVAAVPVAGGGVTNNVTNAPSITINSTNADPKAVAKEVESALARKEREQAAVRRAMLTDKAGY
jgi:hypothetical protein